MIADWKGQLERSRKSVPISLGVPIPLTCHEYTQTIYYGTDYAMYHIRRNDLLRLSGQTNTNLVNGEDNKLNTSPANISATYKNDSAKHPGALLYMTDEQDPEYIAELEAQLAAVNPDVTRVDRLFAGCHTDNFCIYCNCVQLKKRASFTRLFGLRGLDKDGKKSVVLTVATTPPPRRDFTAVAPAGAVGVGDPLAAERLALLRSGAVAAAAAAAAATAATAAAVAESGEPSAKRIKVYQNMMEMESYGNYLKEKEAAGYTLVYE